MFLHGCVSSSYRHSQHRSLHTQRFDFMSTCSYTCASHNAKYYKEIHNAYICVCIGTAIHKINHSGSIILIKNKMYY